MPRKRRFSDEPFGTTIEKLLDETGMTYRALAAKTNLSAGYLNHLVHGNRPVPSNDVIERLAGALTLTIGNAIIKPILALLTLPLIIVTFGLAYFAINVAMLALAEWVAPHFSIDGFWTYVGATIVVWFVNFVLGLIFDRTQRD
jgi:putative membrane protein